MKKRTAIIVFGTLLCSMGGYVAWCWRPFYLPPPLEVEASVSAGGRVAVADWTWSGSYPGPLEFNGAVAWWNLCHPWDCQMGSPVTVMEIPELGLWAKTPDDHLWGFSKTGSEWDASTAFHHGQFRVFSYSPASRLIYRQGAMASRIDAWGAEGATVEILSLGPLTSFGKLVRQAGWGPSIGGDAADFFCDHEVLGRVIVSETGRCQELLDAFARSVREADVDADAPCWGITPRHGIILTHGGKRAEYLLSFDDEDGYAFEEGVDGMDGFYEAYELHDDYPFRGKNRSGPNEANAYFRLSPAYRGVFDRMLDKHGVERVKSTP